jgi:dihydroorotate dehydrogenase
MAARRRDRGLVGVNIAKNKESADAAADYARVAGALAPFADYLAINVSSPNTPGLRGLQNKEELTRLLSVLMEARAKNGFRPVLLKIAPDLDGDALDDIAQSVAASGIEGVIVSNTTIARPVLKSANAHETGGLSGAPLFAPSTEILRQMRTRLPRDFVLIGVGGISCGADAYEKIRAGASLVQLYTGLVYEGPGLIARIKRELLTCLTRDGFASIAEAVGADIRS